MKILITGANGFLGKYILSKLDRRLVFTLSRSNSDLNIDLSKDIPTFTFNFKTVIHCAGIAHYVPKNKNEQDKFYINNLNITKNLIAGFNKNLIYPESLIYISTVAVYGVESGFSIDESYPLLGNSPYAKSKIESEELLTEWGKKNGVKILILRLPLIVGENPPGNLGTMIRAIRKGYYFKFNDGTAFKSVVSANDVADFIVNNLNSEGIYNLTDGKHPTLAEIEKKIEILLNKKIHRIPSFIIYLMSKLGDVFIFFPINSVKMNKLKNDLTFSDLKARDVLQWNPNNALDDLNYKP